MTSDLPPETELGGATSIFRPSLETVRVPAAMKPVFDSAQRTVREYFEGFRADPGQGTIEIAGARYLLVRASALSLGFLDTVRSLYRDRGNEEAFQIGREFQFDIAHVVGMDDARSFHAKMGLTDPIAKLSAGPVHFAYTGWAFVDILPESSPSPDEEYFLLYHHPFSFEADAWIRARRRSDFPVCTMNAGYSSGWCEESFGLPLTAVEVACRAKGDENCTFVMAPPTGSRSTSAGISPPLQRRPGSGSPTASPPSSSGRRPRSDSGTRSPLRRARSGTCARRRSNSCSPSGSSAWGVWPAGSPTSSATC